MFLLTEWFNLLVRDMVKKNVIIMILVGFVGLLTNCPLY